MFIAILCLLVVLDSVATAAYVWPGKYDYLEDLYSMSIGSLRSGFTNQGAPSKDGSGLPPVNNSAERVRTAFHDVITADHKGGTGGLDASIIFELDRAENHGAAFNNTFQALRNLVTPRSSMADLLAMSVVASTTTCDGPQIPLRFGRVDAKEAGPAGVPLSTDSVDSSTNTFSKAGFNSEEMIKLVACGHTLGRVHSVNFPNLVDGPISEDNNVDFDTTRSKFDNLVVTEFLDGTTKNALVVAKNDSFNSDKRIFSINDRAVVQGLSNSDNYRAECAKVFQRMIDTVPAIVRLSEPMTQVDIKPYITRLQLQKDGKLLFEGRIRFRKAALTTEQDLAVFLQVTTSSPQTHSFVIKTTRAEDGDDEKLFAWYDFSTSMDAQAGIKSFDIQVHSRHHGQSAAQEVIFDNSGTGGYPVNTDVLYQLSNSCLDTSSDPGKLVIVTAIRSGSRSDSEGDCDDHEIENDCDGRGKRNGRGGRNGRGRRGRGGGRDGRGRRRGRDGRGGRGRRPRVRVARLVPQSEVMLPRLEIDTIAMEKTDKQIGPFDHYRAETELGGESWSSTFEIVAGGRTSGNMYFLEELSKKNCED